MKIEGDKNKNRFQAGGLNFLEEAQSILQTLADQFFPFDSPAAHPESLQSKKQAKPLDLKLYQTEAKYKALVEQIPAITFIASFEGGLSEIYISPQVENVLGYTQKEWLGDPILWYERLHPDDKERWNQEFSKVIIFGQSFRSVYRFLARDGRVVWIHGEAKIVRNELGIPMFIQGVGFDITEIKEAEEKIRNLNQELEDKVSARTADLAKANQRLQELFQEQQRIAADLRFSEERFRTLTQQAPVGIFLADTKGDALFINDQWQNLAGFPASEGEGRGWAKALHPEDSARVQQEWSRATSAGETFTSEYRFRHPDGKIIWVVAQASPLKSESGELAGYIGTITNITERKIWEQETRQYTEALKRSNDELQQFAYVASHDLQEPLRMVTIFTQLLADRYKEKLDQEARQYIDFATEGAQRSQQLINALLEYSRLRTSAEVSDLDANELLKESLLNLQVRVMETGARITHDPLPQIKGDKTKLIQLFQNLIGNALKFVKDNVPRVHISAAENASEWIFSVRDNGIGIPPEFMQKIFVIFQRLHSRSDYPGTGIGLAICKKIVENHGGRIWVESETGQGSVFSFSISKHQKREIGIL